MNFKHANTRANKQPTWPQAKTYAHTHTHLFTHTQTATHISCVTAHLLSETPNNFLHWFARASPSCCL